MFRKKKRVIAFDIGGTNMRCGLVRGKKILKLNRCETPKNQAKLLKKIVEMTEEFIEDDVSGIGVGFPSTIKDGFIKSARNLNVKNLNLKKYLGDKFECPVEVANDVDCAALAELKFGIKKKNFFVIALGTGVGGGIIVNGKLYHGAEVHGSELGRIIIRNNKDMEDLWKGTKKRIEKEFGKGVLIRDLCKMKNKRAQGILEDAASYLGKGIASVVNALDSEIVVLGGGVRDSGKKFLKMVDKETKRHSLLPAKIKVIWGKVSEPGVIGASLLLSEPQMT